MKTLLLLFVVGVVAGGLLGRRGEPAQKILQATPHIERTARETPRKTVSQIRAEMLSAQRLDFTKHTVHDLSPSSEVVADWTEEEIREALDDAVSRADFALNSHGYEYAAQVLLQEWVSRNPDAAVAWFDGLRVPATQRKLAFCMSMGWPAERASEGLDFAISHKDLFTVISPWVIVEKNVVAEASKGPAELAKLIERLSAEGFEMDVLMEASLPEGFNFAGFMESDAYQKNKSAQLLSSMSADWLSRDIPAAADWLMKHGGTEELVRATKGNKFMLNSQLWGGMGNVVKELPVAQQREFLHGVQAALEWNPPGAENFVKAMSGSPISDEIHESAANVILNGYVVSAVTILEGIDDPARRVSILESLAQPDAPSVRASKRSAEEKDYLKQSLSAWGATAQQSETILNRFAP